MAFKKTKNQKNQKTIRPLKKKEIEKSFFLAKISKNYLPKIKKFTKQNWSTVIQKKKRIFVIQKQKQKQQKQQKNKKKTKRIFGIQKKKLIFLEKKLKSKLSPFFFKPWLKKRVFLTKKQRYLRKLYARYRTKYSLKKRKNFLKTSFGEILKITHLHSEYRKGLWLRGWHLEQKQIVKKIKKKKFYIKKLPWCKVDSHNKQYQFFTNSMQKGWLYENLLKKKSSPKAIHFPLDRPQTAFQNHFKQQKKAPWIDDLLFKRWVYFGFIEKHKKECKKRSLKKKDYLQTWNPRLQKRNKLYWWRRKLLFDFYHENIIKKDKAKRIKQVLGKIYFPFYGHLKQKQFQRILKKKNRIKSQLLNKNETVLSSLENRLDVVVYRLNLAPNILWSRRLIQEGSIFVNNIFSSLTWTSMYSQFKHLNFPLKLRDPKNLYQKHFWNPNRQLSQFKFLLKPTKKIHYLVKAGDFIQSAKSLSTFSIKINQRLFQKPMSKHLYTLTKTKFEWNNGTKVADSSLVKKQEPKQQTKAALFLFSPRFTDLQRTGRIKELFFRWMTL